MSQFYPLKIKEIIRETSQAVSLSFEIPENFRNEESKHSDKGDPMYPCRRFFRLILVQRLESKHHSATHVVQLIVLL